MLAELLRAWGHQTRVASDGAATIAAVHAFHPDAVLLDLGLPDMTGYDVARRLREESGEALHLVAVTGYGGPEDRRRTREAGFDEHLTKPVDAEVLERLLARSAPEPEPVRP